jgi:hypothetical protein
MRSSLNPIFCPAGQNTVSKVIIVYDDTTRISTSSQHRQHLALLLFLELQASIWNREIAKMNQRGHENPAEIEDGLHVVHDPRVEKQAIMSPPPHSVEPRPYQDFIQPNTRQQQPPPALRILGMRKATFLLSCVAAFLVVGLAGVAGALGNRIMTLETKQSQIQR